MAHRRRNVKFSKAKRFWVRGPLRLKRKNPIFSREFVVLPALTALLALSGGIACAQKPPKPKRDAGTVQGTIRNVAGEVIADAEVRLGRKDSSTTVEAKSGREGRYSFSSVVPGTYIVTAEKAGWKKATSGALVLSAGETKQVDLQMELTPGVMAFDDQPNFTVAGVTDWNNTGIHGSDTNQRTGEALVKETLALKPGEEAGTAGNAAIGETENEWKKERERLNRILASAETPDGHRRLAELDERLGDPLGAVSEYERAVRMQPSEPNYFAWGTELLLHRADQPAAEVFAKGVRAHPESARMLAGWGAALYAEGNAEEAALKLCEAADLRPAEQAAYLLLGRIEKGSPTVLPCSKEKLGRFAREQPGNALANYYYAIVLWKQDRGTPKSEGAQQAEAFLEKAAEIDPKLGEAFLQLGILHFAQGKYEQAIRDYQKAMESSPLLSEPHYRLALTYRRKQEEAKAEQEFYVYGKMTKAETAAQEKERRELKQFLIILKDQPLAPK